MQFWFCWWYQLAQHRFTDTWLWFRACNRFLQGSNITLFHIVLNLMVWIIWRSDAYLVSLFFLFWFCDLLISNTFLFAYNLLCENIRFNVWLNHNHFSWWFSLFLFWLDLRGLGWRSLLWLNRLVIYFFLFFKIIIYNCIDIYFLCSLSILRCMLIWFSKLNLIQLIENVFPQIYYLVL